MKSHLRHFVKTVLGSKTPSNWDSYSKLYIQSSNSNWVLDSIKKEMLEVCKNINIPIIDERYGYKLKLQSIFYTSKYDVLEDFKIPKNRIAFPYYHGDPRREKKFQKLVKNIEINHKYIDRIQVSQSYIESLVLNTGIDENKVHRIPISIDINQFPFRKEEEKINFRRMLNISEDSFLIGSFQKDGNGWGKGEEPKLIKGPDIFLKVIGALKHKIDNLAVLLTGPSRGYVKKGLEEMGVSYYHFNLDEYAEISKFYRALDLYLITSREEGGPRAVFESMASGIPLVTTKVGQAMDVVEHNKNSWMVDVEDIEGLVEFATYVYENSLNIEEVLYNARMTAESNSYESQYLQWLEFMRGFVELR